MMNRHTVTWDRIGALFGVLFVALSFTAFALTGDSNPPSPDAPAGVLADYLGRSQPSDLAISAMLLSVFCFLCFLAYLTWRLRAAEVEDGWLAPVAYGGGLIFAGMLLVQTAIYVAVGVVANDGNDPQVAKTLYVLGWDMIYVFSPPAAALVGATSAIILRHAGLPRWLGWVSLPFALVLVIPPLAWPGVPLFYLWVGLVSIVLLTRSIRVPRRSPVVQPV